MNCPTEFEFELLELNGLDEAAAKAHRQHAETCPACRRTQAEAGQMHAMLMEQYEPLVRRHAFRRADFLEALASQRDDAATPSDDAATQDSTHDAVDAAHSPAPLQRSWLRFRSVRFGLAGGLAACIMIATIISLVLPRSVALSAVIENLGRVRTVTYTMSHYNKDGRLVLTKDTWFDDVNGMRIDSYSPPGMLHTTEFLLTSSGEWYTIIYPRTADQRHEYWNTKMTPEERTGYVGTITPTVWLNAVINVTINNPQNTRRWRTRYLGQSVEVFERVDGDRRIRFWIDTHSLLFLRLEAEWPSGELEVFENFNWNAPIDNDVFNVVLGDDYVQIPSPY